jgi:NADH-quinone oxidoreductase subunit G
MAKAKVNGIEVEFEPGMTVLQVAELAGEEIPRFCYHERLSIAGNCRMCLVEVKPGPPKPQASCALPAADGQEIWTNTPLVKRAREGVMEFLLINHPLDCPICDQGGECDLQDQAMGYGRDGSRFAENKRAVEDKYMGPLIKTEMTRCIQCTRCVRFAAEVAGVPEVGAIGRGEDMEITTYLEGAVTSELSGNLIDLCPVGALTSKPYAFAARPWELKKTETIDVMDAIGSWIRIDARGPEALRVLPRINDDINEEWISDKTRFAIDGLKRQRLDIPYVRVKGKLKAATWDEALTVVADRLRGTKADKVGVIAGDLNTVEEMKAALDLFRSLGIQNTDCRQDGSVLGGDRGGYLFNTGLAGIEAADAVLLIGCNPRLEAPVLNARLRKMWIKGTEFAAIGAKADLTYDVTHVGDGPDVLASFAKSGFAKIFKAAKNPAIIIGPGALNRADSAAILKGCAALATAFKVVRADWNGFNVLHTAAARVGGLDLGFVPGAKGLSTPDMVKAAKAGKLETVVLMGADEIDMASLGKAFVIYIGHHGDAGAARADVVLPGAAYAEKPGIYVNTEGRVQVADRATFPKGEAKEDWAIFRALSDRLGKTLPYDTLADLRAKLIADHPVFGAVGVLTPAKLDLKTLGQEGVIDAAPFAAAANFYFTNVIARASATMAACAAAAAGQMAEQV